MRSSSAPTAAAPSSTAHARTEPHQGYGLGAGLKKRWPTWLAIALGVLLAPGTSVQELADLLPMLGFGYLAAAAVQRRQSTWVLMVIVFGIYAVVRLQSWVDPLVLVFAAALAILIWAAAAGRLWPPGAVALETAGMVAFTAIAMWALSVDMETGRYIVAAGWLGHAAWDAAHHWADRVVARSFAEWCAVFDVLRATAILVLPVA